MKLKYIVWSLIGGAIIFIIAIVFGISSHSNSNLIIEPDDGMTPVLLMIRNANVSIDLVIYELADQQIEEALIAAEKRGVAVRVLLSLGYEGESSSVNQPAYKALKANGVAVRWTSPAFSFTHQKTFIIDNDEALIMSFNLVSKYYATGRDFGFFDHDKKDVAAIESVFNADWQGASVTPASESDLVWSPDSKGALINLINSAKISLDIYNEEMADTDIINALVYAAGRGVTVDVDMTYSYDSREAFQDLAAAGVSVRTYDIKSPLYIHAKMILVDNSRAFVGSENFSWTSLESNRELGIIISDPSVIRSLKRIFDADWQEASPFGT